MCWFPLLLLLLALDCLAGSESAADEDLEVVLLPRKWSGTNATVPLSFTAFGKKVDLILERNENLASPSFEIWRRGDDGLLRRTDGPGERPSCHYIHEDAVSSAALSSCDSGSVTGFVFLENDSLEITPLGEGEPRISGRSAPHLVKRRRLPSYGRPRNSPADPRVLKEPEARQEAPSGRNESRERLAPALTIELAVFLDATAYARFSEQLGPEESRLVDLLLAYVNNVQALYYHPSLGQRIRVALVRLEMMVRQPEALEGLDGERGRLLDTFCRYSKELNPRADEDPRHWDVALYVSGLDFYALEEEPRRRNPLTMGLAPVGGVCWDEYACVITEFGVSNRLGKPYPSAGFTSVYIAAHEIAHNLGMHHDSTGNDCPRDGYIMSPSRGTRGEAQWSRCSRAFAEQLARERTKPCLLDGPTAALDHSGRFAESPGRLWTAKQQCELLLRDPEARADDLQGGCQALRCSSPEREGHFLAGPPLDGTQCTEAGGRCRAGECLPP